MENVKVEICCGTACYLLGAANMMNIEDQLPESWRGRVEVEAKTCLELCERENLGGAPYVRINGTEKKGKLELEYYSRGELERLVEILSGV